MWILVLFISTLHIFNGIPNNCFVPTPLINDSVIVRAPSDVLISTEKGVDVLKLKDPLNPYAGKVVTDSAFMNELITYDRVCSAFCHEDTITGFPGSHALEAAQLACRYFNELFLQNHPDSQYALSWGMDGLVQGVDSFRIDIRDLRKCEKGLIERIVTGYDEGLPIRDTQRIWMVNCKPFFINTQDLCDPYDDLLWPYPYCDSGFVFHLNGCIGVNDSLPEAILKNTDGTQLAVDLILEFLPKPPVQGICQIQLNKWRITDWCIYDPFKDKTKGTYTYYSTYEFSDTIGPEPKILIQNCGLQSDSMNPNNCVSPVLIRFTSSDNCTTENMMKVSYKIDLMDDSLGIYQGYDIVTGPSTYEQYRKRDSTPQINPFAFYPAHPLLASGNYPIGKHRIELSMIDGCGNMEQTFSRFEVIDCIKPKLDCKQSGLEFILPQSGSIIIPLSELVDKVEDNCSDNSNIKLYLNGNLQQKSLSYSCAEFAAIGSRLIIRDAEIYAEDEQGNSSRCRIVFGISDEHGVCPLNPGNSDSAIVRIITAAAKPVHEFDIVTWADGQSLPPLHSGCTDSILVRIPSKISSFDGFQFFKSASHLEGLDIGDLILIQNQLSGSHKMNSLQIQAADVDGSLSVTNSDLIEIENIILNKAESFTNPFAGWNIVSTQDSLIRPRYFCLDSCLFVAIKSGDINHNAISQCGEINEFTGSCLNLIVPEFSFGNGDEVYIIFKSSNFKDIRGFQIEIDIDSNILEKIELLGASELQGIQHHFYNKNRLSILWNPRNDQSLSLPIGSPLFTLFAKSKTSGSSKQAIDIHHDRIMPLAYTAELEPRKICINGSTHTDEIVLIENNIYAYFTDSWTRLAIHSSQPIKAENLKLFNMQGQAIQVQKQLEYENSCHMDTESLPPGIYLVQWIQNQSTHTQVVIKLH